MKIKVHPLFIEDFNLCLEYYGCTKDEAQYEKERILKSEEAYYQASVCFSIIAAGIRESDIDGVVL